ncbi:sigma factor-like helix-turn-helix DNA-binding protein [Streptomyces althioticus]|uniref:sigma factor-like helix-turn-helix DNA-binding protein n=1 Tax=Streptomyces althioticus TaxID=83380 RepID=UPI003D801AEB
MSIVAERPVSAQVADRSGGGRADVVVSAGLAEEIERQEREDNARGYEREPESRVPVVPARRVTPSYTAPERVDLRTGEDRPLTAVQAQQVALLVEEHHDHLVRYVAARLRDMEWAHWVRAEDVAQDVWLHVARGRVPELLKKSPDLPWPRLAATAKWSLLENTTTKRRREWLVRVPEGDDRSADEVLEALAGPGPDGTVCAVLDVLEAEAGSGAGWAPACYAARIAALPARQREVLELRCVDGMTTPAMAARLGISRQSVESALRKALTALGGSGRMPGARTRGAGEPLPEGWERVLDRLPNQTQRDVVRLRAAGASFKELSEQLGIHRGYSHELYTRALRSLREMVVDHRLDPEPAAPARHKPKAAPSPKSCAQQCASGCYLRTARTGAAA